MTRVINFDKSFKYTVAVSVIIIVAGLVGLGVIGLNNGVDFQAGLNSDVAFVPSSMGVSFAGEGSMSLKVSKADATFISRAPSGDSKAYTFTFAQYPTFQDLVAAFKTVPGVSVDLKAKPATDSKLLLGASQADSQLGQSPTLLHYAASGDSAVSIDVEKIRASLKAFGDVSIQRVGSENSHEFMIRIQDPGKDPQIAKTIVSNLTTDLGAVFGPENVLVNQTTFVGARFSEALAKQALWLTLGTFLLILMYCSFRFKPVYAIGAVLSVVHDALVMLAFIVFTRMEFDTTIIAAILTIVGYSINDTIVIYDRIREKVKFNPGSPFRDNMNKGVTECLARTFITSGTVLLAALALFIFTTGSMKNFSLCIIVGVITGTYSSTFIASAFVDGWRILEARRAAKKQAEQASLALAAKTALAVANPPRGGKASKKQ